jgi:hypothetical protein
MLLVIFFLSSTLIPSVLVIAKRGGKPGVEHVSLVKAYGGEMSLDPGSPYRWMDVNDYLYAVGYREGYDYSLASVRVSYKAMGETFMGSLTASNLKPNFAYQLKLEGIPGDPSNELIGYTGRWWYTTESGAYGNAVDSFYEDHKDDSSYTFTGYLLFEYFVTDENGDAVLEFEQDSSYHVLWKTSQRTQQIEDGPVKYHTFDPDPASLAYSTDYGPATVGVYGEVERPPVGGKYLPEGKYHCKVFLTEESFHSSQPYGGCWGGAMEGEVSFKLAQKDNGNGKPDKPHPVHPNK